MPRRKKTEAETVIETTNEAKVVDAAKAEKDDKKPVAKKKASADKSPNEKKTTSRRTTKAKKTDIAVDTSNEVKVETPIAEVKTEDKPVKKTAAKKATKKATPNKRTKKIVEPKVSVKLQFGDAEYDLDELKSRIEAAYKAKADVQTVDIYIKPEEGKAYYVINTYDDDSVDL